jgi:hypothetical protein
MTRAERINLTKTPVTGSRSARTYLPAIKEPAQVPGIIKKIIVKYFSTNFIVFIIK